MNSWKAAGHVKPVWLAWGKKNGVRKAVRDEFALQVGTTGTVLSALNSGAKSMTPDMAARIARVGGVSVLELGAPVESADEGGQSLLDLLRELQGTVDTMKRTQARILRRVTALERALGELQPPDEAAEGSP